MRHKPGNRRALETFDFKFENTTYHISYSRYPNGNVSEVFVVCGKPGSAISHMGRDLGIAISVMLQSGMLLSDLSQSMTRLDDGSPAGPLGALIEHLMEEW